MIYFVPFISALIGWVTNYLAIKMLFHPRNERNFFLFKIQGIFPKRKNLLAQQLGAVVSNKLFSIQSLKEEIASDEARVEISRTIEMEVEKYIRSKLKEKAPLLSRLVNENMISQVINRIHQEMEALIPKMMSHLEDRLDSLDIEEMVYQKVSHFSNERIEDLLMGVIRKELKFIEFAGAALGFAIGLIQVGLLYIDII